MEQIFTWINSNGWFVSLFTLIFGAMFTASLAKKKEILIKIAEKKSEYYSGYINSLLGFEKLIDVRTQDTVFEKVNKNYFYYKNMVILFGSDDVIAKLAACEEKGINTESEEGKIIYTELINAMKRDIENPKMVKSFWKRKSDVSIRERNINTILFNYKQD